ncbi:DUF4430 domain-containing protein [Aureibacillus halotolerans]|uniref:Uncharacterized protein DUF4430 n=1 Tax=Aureibacillus halotolerans TaxID=1508390 RepID=A0A4R6U8G2_9BACI|nr:DUF4430 domain-containing protein [Aureibacillus halotolerans]TDQ42022.1 uncharacterized protein DUF4430 [Aureibacillus halotolerans]
MKSNTNARSLLSALIVLIGLVACSSPSPLSVSEHAEKNELAQERKGIAEERFADNAEISSQSGDEIDLPQNEEVETDPPETPEKKPSTQGASLASEKEAPKTESDQPTAESSPPSASTTPPPKEQAVKEEAPKKSVVSISIIGLDGPLLNNASIPVEDGDSVFDVLVTSAKKERLPVDSSGAGALVYVRGIQSYYEFDHGPASGWMFTVNGVPGNKSAGATDVVEGDVIVWEYTTELPPPTP